MKIIYTPQPEIGLFSELVESLVVHKSQNILMLLCGGSTMDVYKYFVEKQDAFKFVLQSLHIKDLSNITLALTDDRWFEDNKNENINVNQIRNSGFYDLFESLGAKVITVTKSQDMQQDALDYSSLLKNLVGTRHGMSLHIISVCGIGENFHTCAIFPNDDLQDFDNLYMNENNYAVAEKVDDTFTDRITITVPMLSKSNEIYVYTKGEHKKPVLQELINNVSADPNKVFNHKPALLFTELDNVKIYTDCLL